MSATLARVPMPRRGGASAGAGPRLCRPRVLASRFIRRGLLRRGSDGELTSRGAAVAARAARRVAVVGAGVMGVTTALQLRREHPQVHVDLIAEHDPVRSTSHGSGGLWMPFALPGARDEDVLRWGGETWAHLAALQRGPDAAAAGVQLVAAHCLVTDAAAFEPPFWRGLVHAYRELDAAALARYGYDGGGIAAAAGYTFETLIVEQPRYLPWLWRQLGVGAGGESDEGRGAGGVTWTQRRLSSLDQLDGGGYAVIFNCAGLGANQLVSDDSAAFPTRGQVRRVRAPWIKHAFFLDDGTYLIPNVDTLVVGGLAQAGDWNEDVDARDAEVIWARALAAWPSLAAAEVVTDWAGLRPSRHGGPRLERIARGGGAPVVHCYGHGGSGITLHWGCAAAALQLAREDLQ